MQYRSLLTPLVVDADHGDVILRTVSDGGIIEPFPVPNRGPGDSLAPHRMSAGMCSNADPNMRV
jgi:hypothetical protein